MSSNNPLQCLGVSCGYPGRVVLTGIDLEFRPGTSTALIGPNGSGKSTLLKTLTGEVAASSGEVRVNGKLVQELSIAEIGLQIAVVPQQEHIPFRFSVWEVVMMGRLVRSPGIRDTPEDRAAVERALRFTDCENLAHRPVNEVSGGEKQRVLLARALAQETEIILLDEPTTHLDITHQLDLCRLVRELTSMGKTIVAAMHDLNLLPLISSDAVLLGSGSLQLVGTVEGVLNAPQLDEVYQVGFRRTKDGGNTLVLPPSI